MTSPAPSTVCCEPSCTSPAVVGGSCRRCYSRRWKRANRERIREQRRACYPVTIRPVSLIVRCLCGARLELPPGSVETLVCCPRCARVLQVVLWIDDERPPCPMCGAALPPDAYPTARYCSSACRVAIKETRRAPVG